MAEDKYEVVKKYIEEADAVLITAGAGMGVDSGLPDFRGNEGFWKAYPPIAKMGYSFEEMASPIWFEQNPRLAWAFYGHRFNLYRHTDPHEGFNMLLELTKKKNDNYFVFTSNVDGQFQKAGFDEDKIVEVHGSIHHWQCPKRCSKDIWEASDKDIEVDMEKFEAIDIPLCPHCGNVARPNILMFGDWEWFERRTYKQKVRLNKWLKSLNRNQQKLAIIEIGAGKAVPTVRYQGERVVQEVHKSMLIRLNPRDFDIDEKYGLGFSLGGLEGLKALIL